MAKTTNPPKAKLLITSKTKTLKNYLQDTLEEKKELSSRLERTVFESKLFREINTAITSTFELPEILSLILQVFTTLVNTQGVSIVLVDNSDGTLRIAEHHDLSGKDIENFYIYYAKLQNSIFKDILQKGTPRFFDGSENLVVPIILSVPLVSRKKVIGFLNIHSMYKNIQLTPDKIELVYALASQASIAISNAQLFQALREQAIIDSCTNLYNFRYFQQKLDEEIDIYNTVNEPLSLIILDIDHFKKVNDTHGHIYGDTVLRELGNILKRNVRSEDSVCRYGGEEFAIIFPHCTQEVTLRIAERIRARIKDTTSHDRRSIFKDPITVSIGVTEYAPELGKIAFIQRADNALYYAKNHGRNIVAGYDPELESEYAKYQKKK